MHPSRMQAACRRARELPSLQAPVPGRAARPEVPGPGCHQRAARCFGFTLDAGDASC